MTKYEHIGDFFNCSDGYNSIVSTPHIRDNHPLTLCIDTLVRNKDVTKSLQSYVIVSVIP